MLERHKTNISILPLPITHIQSPRPESGPASSVLSNCVCQPETHTQHARRPDHGLGDPVISAGQAVCALRSAHRAESQQADREGYGKPTALWRMTQSAADSQAPRQGREVGRGLGVRPIGFLKIRIELGADMQN